MIMTCFLGFFCSAGNVFDCDCSLLWMNRLAVETTNEQVSRAFSDAQCLMNDTADDVDYSTGSRADHKTLGDGHNRMSDAQPAADVGGPSSVGDIPSDGTGAGAMPSDGIGAGVSDGTGVGVSDGTFKAYDESQLTKVSALTEDTCPGKEQPLVDGAPDAAQNSDRVLWESNNNASGAGTRLVRSSATLSVLLSVLVFAVRRRLC